MRAKTSSDSKTSKAVWLKNKMIEIFVMRKMMSTKAGATFHQETPTVTFAMRKDCIELIFKLKVGMYMVLSLHHADDAQGMLFANWGTYFNRMTNPQVQLPQVKKCCPTLYDIMTGNDNDGIQHLELGSEDTDKNDGMGMFIALPEKRPLIECLNRELIEKAEILVDKMLTVYNELIRKPPFPAWKTGLDEVWE